MTRTCTLPSTIRFSKLDTMKVRSAANAGTAEAENKPIPTNGANQTFIVKGAIKRSGDMVFPHRKFPTDIWTQASRASNSQSVT